MIDLIKDYFTDTGNLKPLRTCSDKTANPTFCTTITFATRYMLGWGVWEVLRDKETWKDKEGVEEIINNIFDVDERVMSPPLIKEFLRLAYIYYDFPLPKRFDADYVNHIVEIVNRNVRYLKLYLDEMKFFDVQNWANPDYDLCYPMFSNNHTLLLLAPDYNDAILLKLLIMWRVNQEKYENNKGKLEPQNKYMYYPPTNSLEEDYITTLPTNIQTLTIINYKTDKVYKASKYKISEDIINWVDNQLIRI